MKTIGEFAFKELVLICWYVDILMIFLKILLIKILIITGPEICQIGKCQLLLALPLDA